MVMSRGRALRWPHGRSAVLAARAAAYPGAAEVGPSRPFAPVAVTAAPSSRSRSFAAMSGECSGTVNAGIKSLCLMPSLKPKPGFCIESMPSEMLMKIFSYLDAESLLSIGCVNKRFYDLASDKTSLSFSEESVERIDMTVVTPPNINNSNCPSSHFQLDLCEKGVQVDFVDGIWLKIYSMCFHPKRTRWKMKSRQTGTISLGCAALCDRKPGYWKKKYIFKQIDAVKTRVMRLLKPIDPCSGLPYKNKEAMKVSGLSWMIVLKDKNSKEHVMEKANLSFNHTSVTILWYSTDLPCLDVLSTLKLYGVMPLLPDRSGASSKNGPRLRSLIAEYRVANLTESSVVIGADKLVQLFSLNPELSVGLWKEKNEIAFVMASLHYYQLFERSTLGSATVQYALPPNKRELDDVDPEYGLHDYLLHVDMHGRSCDYLCGVFRGQFCREGDVANGYLRLTVVSLDDETKHVPLPGTLGLSWETDVFKGYIEDCYVMDVTFLNETGYPFWHFSAPVCMELSSKASCLYDYRGPIYTTDCADAEEGKVSVEFIWLEETKEYIIVSLVLYLSTKKINDWYGTNY